jgi:HD-GYP domain-containing protein (c-di-GMP phosphodiesterase class II)
LIKKDDTAMYYSKQSGRNQCNIYSDNMNVFSKYSNKDINKELLMDSVLALAEAVDAKDEYTGEHSKMVSKYSILLAEKLGLTESEKNKLRIGSLLHDCGCIPCNDIRQTI